MKKLTEKQKKFARKFAIASSFALAMYLAYKAGTKNGFENGCFYAADCFTAELMSGDNYKMKALAADDSCWFDVNAIDCNVVDGRIKFIGQKYELVKK